MKHFLVIVIASLWSSHALLKPSVSQIGNNMILVKHGEKDFIFVGPLGFNESKSYSFTIDLAADKPKLNIDEELSKANSFYLSSKYNKASTVIDALLKQEPNNARAIAMRGSILMVLGSKDAALKEWQRALELSDKNSSLYLELEEKINNAAEVKQ